MLTHSHEQQTGERTRWWRRVPSLAWIFLPLALASLYAAAHAIFRRHVAWDALPPPNTVYLVRWRNPATYDGWEGVDLPAGSSAIHQLGGQLNLRGFPGLDPRHPLQRFVLADPIGLEREVYAFRTLDIERTESRFERHGLEDGETRHARYWTRFGDIGVVARDLDALRHLGANGLPLEAKDEDLSFAARMEPLWTHAFQRIEERPWRRLLSTLGVDVERPVPVGTTPDGVPVLRYEGAQRLAELEAAWHSIRAWIWFEEDTVAWPRAWLEFAPKPGPWADLLETLANDPPLAAGSVLPALPPEADVGIGIQGRFEAQVLRHAAWLLGAPLADEAGEPAAAPAVPERPNSPARDAASIWFRVPAFDGRLAPSYVAAARDAPLAADDLPPFGAPWEGALAGGEDSHGQEGGGWRLVAAGPQARRAVERVSSHLATGATPVVSSALALERGRLLGRAHLRRPAASALLGWLLEPKMPLFTFDLREVIVEVRAVDGNVVVILGCPP